MRILVEIKLRIEICIFTHSRMEVDTDVLIDTEPDLNEELSDDSDDMMDDGEAPINFPKLAPSLLEV